MVWGSAGFFIGLVLGSFGQALADRSLGKKSFWGRSYCPNCKHKLAWYDLFPIFSFVLLKGRCRYCRKKISLEYPIIEIVLGALIAYLFVQTQFSFVTVLDLILKIFFIVILAVLFLTDLKKMLIPDRVIIPSIYIGLVGLVTVTIIKIGYLYYYLSQSAIGRLLLPPHSEYFQRHAFTIAEPLLLGILMGLLIGGFFFSLIIITKGKGMGGGDVKLGAFIGIMLGFPLSLLALILSFITGAVFSVGLIIAGKKRFGQTIPFGPFLVLGSLIALFWGNQIIDWYLKLGY
ncbi:MAG: prepilin peptidase [Candidatus Daviesbacteria bacterium]|nr:prepilin peptidase [Candidatus Daviesbacteria bacterium]